MKTTKINKINVNKMRKKRMITLQKLIKQSSKGLKYKDLVVLPTAISTGDIHVINCMSNDGRVVYTIVKNTYNVDNKIRKENGTIRVKNAEGKPLTKEAAKKIVVSVLNDVEKDITKNVDVNKVQAKLAAVELN